MYFEADLKLCELCHLNCATCIDEREDSCLSCRNDEHLLEGNKCVDNCSESSFEKEGSCKPCDSSCASCSDGTPEGCYSCSSEDSLMKDYKCVDECGAGYFPDEKICKKCHIICATCENEKDCTSCVNAWNVL